MRFEHEYFVPAPPEEAFRGLSSVPTIADCMPGAAVGAQRPDGSYPGRMKVKLGAVNLEYRGTLRIVNLDEDAGGGGGGRIVIEIAGDESHGQGAARATIDSTLSARDDGTGVRAVSEVTITGRAANFARPDILHRVAERLLAEFAKGLERELKAGRAPS